MTAAQHRTFGEVLRRLRRAAELTQEELAERAGLSRRGITDLERGARRTPQRETLALLIEALAPSAEDRAALLAAARHRFAMANAPAASATVPVLGASPPCEAAPVVRPTAVPPVDQRNSATAQARPVSAGMPPDERKLVTVLFADVAGSTTLGESLDPEDMRALLGRYYAHAQRIISAHGGTLEKFIGDAVMAIFGLPAAHGNDAERTLAAALALRAAVDQDELLGGRLVLRIGINTGVVVAAPQSSSADFLVTGDAVNVAARLQQAGASGDILTSHRTQSATQASFLFAEPRIIQVKGKARPLTVYPLVGRRPTREMSHPPLVGRRQDLAQLALLRDRALSERRPQLVTIIAPAGMGKTRLLEEFLARLDSTEGFQVATARCVPYGQTLTYWPLRGLLEHLLGVAPTLERVTEAFAAGSYAPQDAERLARLVLVTLGIAAEENAEREAIFQAWRLLIESLASLAPRILVFEDLHWASDSLLDLVEQLLRPRAGSALLFVATSRPELLDRRRGWGGGWGNATTLTLSSLSSGQTGELLAWLAGGLPAALSEPALRRIIERSGGNPFFAIELTHALTQGGTADASTPETLPDTVHEALLARLDLLAPREREVLRVAAVEGRAFRSETLKAILTVFTEHELEVALEDLLARELIVPTTGNMYAFRHVLIRDVAYGTLSRAERIRLHAAVALWLENSATDHLDELTELIAYHYREAVLLARQSAVPLELPVDAMRAVQFLERAGEMAGRAGAFNEARAHLESAIALAPEGDHVRLYEKLGDCMQLGDTAIYAYRTAYDRWQHAQGNDPLVGARILRKLLMMYVRWPATWAHRPGDSELAALMAEARHLAETARDEHEIWHVRVAEGFWGDDNLWAHTNESAYRPPRDAESIRAIYLAAAGYFEQEQDWAAFSEALDGYAGLSLQRGAYRDALRALRRRLRASGVPAPERGDAVNMLAHLHLWSGHYGRCVDCIRHAIARLRAGEPIILLGKGPLWASGAAVMSGRWSELDWLLTALEDGWEQAQHDRGMAYLAAGYFVALHVALAQEDSAAVRATESRLEQLLTPSWMHGSQALLAAYRTDDPRYLDLGMSDEVWPYVKMREFRFVGALILMFLSERAAPAAKALLAFARGRWADERADFMLRTVAVAEALASGDDTRLAAAIADAEAHGLVPHAARMRVVLAERTGDRSPLERARPVLQQLGDRQFLRKMEAAEATLR